MPQYILRSYNSGTMKVEIFDESRQRPSQEESIFLSPERPSNDLSVASLDAGPRLRKTSFTFSDVDRQENDQRIAMLMDISEQNNADKSRSKGADSRDLAIEATRRLANVSVNGHDALPTPPWTRRKLSRPSTGSSTISRITTKSNNIVQDVMRPLGRLNRRKSSEPSSARTETDTSGSFTTDPSEPLDPQSPPNHHRHLTPSLPERHPTKSLLPGLEIITGEKQAYAASPIEYVAYPQASPPDPADRLYRQPMVSPSPSRDLLGNTLPSNQELYRFSDQRGSGIQEGDMTLRLGGYGQDDQPTRRRIGRRDSAIKEARMESAVHTMMMGGGSRQLRDETRQRQRSEETVHPTMRRLRTTSEMGAARSRSETAGSRGTSSMSSLHDEVKEGQRVKTRKSRALSDIAATPPITPVKMKPERLFDLPESNHRPSPLYTFPPPQKENLENEPIKVIKPKRSGFMSFLREKMLSRNMTDETMGPDGLSDSQRIRAAYLITTERENVRGEKRSMTMPNVKARPSRTVSQLITPTKDRHGQTRSASMRVRPASMLEETPPRPTDRDARESPMTHSESPTRSALPAIQSVPASLMALKSRNVSMYESELEQPSETDDKARIRKLEEEVRTKLENHVNNVLLLNSPLCFFQLLVTRRAWHSQITHLESQLGRLKDAMTLAKEEAQASSMAERERRSELAMMEQGVCSRCRGRLKAGQAERGPSGLSNLITQKP